MKNIIENIVYSEKAAENGVGDLFLPDELLPETPLALCIHGGGWSALDKARMVDIAEFLCQELGYAVFNINYRLADRFPWPACGEDCLAGAEFLLTGDIAELRGVKREKVLVIGGSAGGHLAVMTGLRMPPEKVSGIVSISGINSVTSDHPFAPVRYEVLFGHVPTEAELQTVDPVRYLTPQSPPVLCTHDWLDNVVPIASSLEFAEAAQKLGVHCCCYFYVQEETGYSHRIFIPGGTRLYRHIEEVIAAWIRKEC